MSDEVPDDQAGTAQGYANALRAVDRKWGQTFLGSDYSLEERVAKFREWLDELMKEKCR